MKSINKFFTVMLGVVAFTLASCDDGNIGAIYDQTAEEQGYMFLTETAGATFGPEFTETSYTFQMARNFAGDAQTINLNVEGADKLFNIPSSVTFAAGETLADITIGIAGMEPGNTYKFTIALNSTDVAKDCIDEVAVKFVVEGFWTSLGMGTFREDFLSTFWSTGNPVYQVEVQENDKQPGLYRMVNPFGEAYPHNEPGDWDDSQDWYFEIHAEDPDRVYTEGQYLGLDWGYGNVYIISYAGYYMENGYSIDQVPASLFGTLKNGIISFPTAQSFLINMAGYSSSLYYTNGSGMVALALPGYALADYTVNVAYEGVFTDAEGTSYVVANSFDCGADVATVKFAVVEGTEVDATVDAIVAGEVEAVEAEAGASVYVPFPAKPVTGKYTIVGVAYNADGEAQEVATATFKYEAASNEETTWTLVGKGDYTYTIFFTEEDGGHYVDAGLELFQCDQDKSQYKIEHWGNDVDFTFTMLNTYAVYVPEQEVGYTYGNYGPVYVCEGIDYTSKTEYGTSTYDPATGTFTFCLAYYVSGGYFGISNLTNSKGVTYETETFVLASDEEDSASAPARRGVKTVDVVRKADISLNRFFMKNAQIAF